VAKVIRSALTLLFLTSIAGVIVWAFLPQPLVVDAATVKRMPLQVTVDEDGKTRIKERYVVSAPLAGKLQRIDLLPGDRVEAGRTVLAILEPTEPQFLDARTIAESKARVQAAETEVQRAKTAIETARLNLENIRGRRKRANEIANSQAISEEELEQIETDFHIAEESYRASVFAENIASFELQLTNAARAQTWENGGDNNTKFKILSPIDGVVLDVLQHSAKVLIPGDDLIEVGDPFDLELEIDVLSKDAVMIRPGDKIEVTGWGGEETLAARVRLVEPSAFTHISALGVEEQRVNVIGDFIGSGDDRAGLGDNFRVEASIVVWRKDSVTVVPTSALYRHKEHWAVFVIKQGRAHLSAIQLGKRNANFAEVLNGIDVGATVIVHPSDKVADGVAVVIRE
jgi:HlyD family secretion protein